MKKFYIKIILANGYNLEEVIAEKISRCSFYYHFYNEINNYKIDVSFYPIDKTIIWKIEEI